MPHTLRRIALFSFALLMVPLIASRRIEGWHWPPQAFLLTYILFFLTGLTYSLITRNRAALTYRAATALALVSGFALGWSTMVHLSETENRIYLMYFAVLALGATGAALSRLQPAGMSRTLFAMAIAIALPLTQSNPNNNATGPFWQLAIAHGGMMFVFAFCGFLYRLSPSNPPAYSTSPLGPSHTPQ